MNMCVLKYFIDFINKTILTEFIVNQIKHGLQHHIYKRAYHG